MAQPRAEDEAIIAGLLSSLALPSYKQSDRYRKRPKPTVTLICGRWREGLRVHRDLLEEESEGLRAPLEKVPDRKEHVTIDLEGSPKQHVRVFLYWLYTGQIPRNDLEWVQFNGDDATEQDALLVMKMGLYRFAEEAICPRFRRALNNNIIETNHPAIQKPETVCAAIDVAFESFAANRVILQWMVETYGSFAHDPDIEIGFPWAFTWRSTEMQYETEIEQGAQKNCYYEHESAEEKAACPGLHWVWKPLMNRGYWSNE